MRFTKIKNNRAITIVEVLLAISISASTFYVAAIILGSFQGNVSRLKGEFVELPRTINLRRALSQVTWRPNAGTVAVGRTSNADRLDFDNDLDNVNQNNGAVSGVIRRDIGTSITISGVPTSSQSSISGDSLATVNGQDEVVVASAPNFNVFIKAQSLRNQMIKDADSSQAVYCLPRIVRNDYRPINFRIRDRVPTSIGRATPINLELPSTYTNSIDTPEAFRRTFLRLEPDVSLRDRAQYIFRNEFHNLPSKNLYNTSIWMLNTNNDLVDIYNPPLNGASIVDPVEIPNELVVNVYYEIDYVKYPRSGFIGSSAIKGENTPGILASVRRYIPNIERDLELQSKYEIFFPKPNNVTASDTEIPMTYTFAFFEKKARTGSVTLPPLPTGSTYRVPSFNDSPEPPPPLTSSRIDQFKLAREYSFYLIWLPDPLINPYKIDSSISNKISSRATGDVNLNYSEMAHKTNLSLILPMFPTM